MIFKKLKRSFVNKEELFEYRNKIIMPVLKDNKVIDFVECDKDNPKVRK